MTATSRYRSPMTTATPGSPEYWAFRARFDAAVAELKAGDDASLALVLTFLEERPRFHGSGYLAERMLHVLDRVALRERDRARVIAVATTIATEATTREGREARLLLARLRA